MLQHIIPYQAKLSPYIIPGLRSNGRLSATQDIIIDAVCSHYDIVFDAMLKRTRKRKIVESRQIAMYLLCYYTTMPLKAIGELFGGYDHTTVIHSRQQINDLLCTDLALAKRVLQIKNSAQLSDRVPAKRFSQTTL